MSTTHIVHFEATFKGKPGAPVVPHCSRWGLRIRNGATTTDKSKVSCTRCAKQLDIKPVEKKVSSTRGTCQCCFGAYETRMQNTGDQSWRLVLHGYNRPGHGYIVGECRGRGHVPFEVSCEQTKVFREELKQILAARKDRLAKIEASEVESFMTKVRTGQRVPSPERPWSNTDEYKVVVVPKGQGRTTNPFMNVSWEQVPSYEELRKRALAEAKAEISAIERNIKSLTEAINTWQPVPFPRSKR